MTKFNKTGSRDGASFKNLAKLFIWNTSKFLIECHQLCKQLYLSWCFFFCTIFFLVSPHYSMRAMDYTIIWVLDMFFYLKFILPTNSFIFHAYKGQWWCLGLKVSVMTSNNYRIVNSQSQRIVCSEVWWAFKEC